MRKSLMVAALAMLTALAPAFAAFDPNRIVTAVDPVAKTFSCQAGASEPSFTYQTTNKTKIRVSGIKVGEVVTVQYHLAGGDRVAIYPKK